MSKAGGAASAVAMLVAILQQGAYPVGTSDQEEKDEVQG